MERLSGDVAVTPGRLIGASVGIAIVVAAFAISLSLSLSPVSWTGVGSAIVLGAAAAIQRARVLLQFVRPKRPLRGDRIHALAQETLLAVCKNRRLGPVTLNVVVHVWEVPVWYRRLFPFRLRQWLRRRASTPRWARLAKYALRPTLGRAAAAALVKPAPTNIRFAKGRGIVGACLAGVTDDDVEAACLGLDTTKEPYASALGSDQAWAALGPARTHGLSREEAVALAAKYRYVIAQIVHDADSGEAIGCVSISANSCLRGSTPLTEDAKAQARLAELARTMASTLAV